MSRNDIFAALFAIATTVTWSGGKTFNSTSRRVKLFSDVDKKLQPAMFQAEHGDVSGQTSNTPYKRVYKADWIVYFNAEAASSPVPAAEMNDLVDAIELVLAVKTTDPGFFDKRNTLHGLVHHCFIDGEIFKDPGDIDGQAMLVVPIKMLVP